MSLAQTNQYRAKCAAIAVQTRDHLFLNFVMMTMLVGASAVFFYLQETLR